ncbi:Coenzyme F420 hydrogenase/dehydrogenase, beta subunit C-terminal domain, partial [Candidatus Parcubacteria bacterium]|nr:Coenzyme F420 hydrogenase/dehydrogenase, beta subunit C-terminal domain [Candidatus Parcubacteria bacterium]
EKCNNCGICYEVCPGHEVDFKGLNLEIFGKEPENVLIGNYLNCYVGYSTDHDIRYNSASGGLITQLLIFALEEGIINGALVTRMKKDKPLEPEPFIARTREEIIEASKSKYCPVPANIALKKILNSEEGEKFAVVGLPCHIHGIRKAEQINKKLKEKIVLHLGIVCNHPPSFSATEFLLKKIKIKKEEVTKLDYRGEGWPGGMTITTKNGNNFFVPHWSSDYWGGIFGSFFFPLRCTLCNDKICRLSDMSFADAWTPELMKNDDVGTSLVISRNEIFEEILNKAIFKEKIELKKVDKNIPLQSQGLYVVKKQLKARIKILRMFGKKIPVYHQDLLDSSFSDYYHALSFYFRSCFLSKRYFWSLISLYRFSLKKASYYKSKLLNSEK